MAYSADFYTATDEESPQVQMRRSYLSKFDQASEGFNAVANSTKSLTAEGRAPSA